MKKLPISCGQLLVFRKNFLAVKQGRAGLVGQTNTQQKRQRKGVGSHCYTS